jgi:DNA-binding XRE family transcriptional regulator
MKIEIQTDEIYEYIGLMIKIYRKKRGLNQGELGKKIGVSRTSIINIEKGNQRIPLEKLYAMAIVLKCQVRQLIP